MTVCGLLLSAFTGQPSRGNDNGYLRAIISGNAKVEKLSSGFKFTEGPLWDPRGFLLFSDIPADTIYKWTSDGKTSVFRRPAGHPNGNTLVD
jgi:gluconolactonase